MGFHEFFLIVRARWRLALLIFAVVAVGVSCLPLLMHTKYTASAFIVVDAKNDPVTGGAGLPEAVMASYINTQADIITSERVAQRVAKSSGLDKLQFFQDGWRKKTGGQGDIDLWLAHYLLTGKRVVAAPPVSASATRQTNVLEIAVTWPDPKLAADIANSFAETAIETNIELKVQPAKQYAVYFDQRSAALRADLEKKQKKLSDFQNLKGIVATDDKLDVENARLAELSTQLVQVQTQRQDAQSRQRQGNGTDDDFLPEVLQSPQIASIKDALATAESKRTEVAGRLGKNHPDYQAAEADVVNLRARLATETRKIVSSLGSAAQVSMRREAELKEAVENQKKRVLELKNAHDEAQNLQNDVTTAQRDLDAVTQRFAQSSLESLAQQTNVVLLSPAAIPLDPSSPKVLMFIAAGLFLGLVFGIGGTLVVEMRDKRLRQESDLIRLSGVPVLGRLGALKPNMGMRTETQPS
jgi:chain length determinant protein EpsF